MSDRSGPNRERELEDIIWKLCPWERTWNEFLSELLIKVCPLLDAYRSAFFSFEDFTEEKTPKVKTFLNAHWTAQQLDHNRIWQNSHRLEHDHAIDIARQAKAASFVITMQDIVRLRGREVIKRYEERQIGRFSDMLASTRRMGPNGEVIGFAAHRSVGEYIDWHSDLVEHLMHRLAELLEMRSRRVESLTNMPKTQKNVLDGLLEALPEKQIADLLNLSPYYVNRLTSTIFKKFNVHSRAQLIKLLK